LDCVPAVSCLGRLPRILPKSGRASDKTSHGHNAVLEESDPSAAIRLNVASRCGIAAPALGFSLSVRQLAQESATSGLVKAGEAVEHVA
jgi:hypothetical protein